MSAGPTPCVAAAKYQKAGTTTSQPLRSISRAASRKFAAPQEAPHQRDCVAKAKDRYWHTSPVAALQHSHQELSIWRTSQSWNQMPAYGAPSLPPHTTASVQPSAANSAARRGASPMEKNSSSCGGFTLVPDSIAWA